MGMLVLQSIEMEVALRGFECRCARSLSAAPSKFLSCVGEQTNASVKRATRQALAAPLYEEAPPGHAPHTRTARRRRGGARVMSRVTSSAHEHARSRAPAQHYTCDAPCQSPDYMQGGGEGAAGTSCSMWRGKASRRTTRSGCLTRPRSMQLWPWPTGAVGWKLARWSSRRA